MKDSSFRPATRWWTAFLLVGLLIAPAPAQLPNVPYQSLLLLVAGPSGDRIDPREKAVVAHLNGIRSSYNFAQLQMGTMHYDRPQEATLLKKTLGFSPAKGITVGLVQLSDKGLPVRTLYKMEQVTQSSLMAAQNDLLSRWSQVTGQPLPRDLRPAGTAGGPTSHGGPPMTSNPPGPTGPPPRPPADNGTRPSAPSGASPTIGLGQGYTIEGIRAVVNAMDEQSRGMWDNLRNAPLRSDGHDLAVREQTKALAESATALRSALGTGSQYPLEQLGAVAQVGRSWQATDPQYYLPVPLRGQVNSIAELLRMVEEIQAQGLRVRNGP